MSNRWTPTTRAVQAKAIRQWQPWRYSTGPTTTDGKMLGSLNSLRHGARAKEAEELKRAVAAFLASVELPK